MTNHLSLSRGQILAHRRRAGALDERLPPGAPSLRRAAWVGLQDSMPRAALLSIHARVSGTQPSTWEDPSLVQLWGPRFSAYVVAEVDRGVFTLGRLPDDGPGRRRAQENAARLLAFLAGRRMPFGEAGHGMGLGGNPNVLRYGAPTGTILMRWDGARQSAVWTVPAPEIGPRQARLELARRHLHVFGPTTPDSFSDSAGIKPPRAQATFDELAAELTPVGTPIGDAWVLAADEASFRAAPSEPALARLLPSGDAYYLLQGAQRALLVPDERRRGRLWTSRVWPGAVVVRGEVVGTWRRADATVSIDPWRALEPAERDAVRSEAESLPLGLSRRIAVRWGD